jgi:hypothetical protein
MDYHEETSSCLIGPEKNKNKEIGQKIFSENVDL